MYYSGMMTNLDYYLNQRPVHHPCKILSTGPISGSFFDVIRGFIQSVNTMESTVLVPTLLKDINLDGVNWVPTLMVKCNYRQLFEIYCAIKKCKSQFIEVDIDEIDNQLNNNNNNTKNNSNNYKNSQSNRQSTIKGRGTMTKTNTTTTTTTPTPTDENPLLVYAIESGIGYLSTDYVDYGDDYCHQQLDQSTERKEPDIPSPSPSTATLSSSSTATSTGSSNRKQKISLDSGNWSSRGSDSVDDDFDFDSTTLISGGGNGNIINGSSPSPTNSNGINCLIDSEDSTTTTINNNNNNLHSQSNQPQSTPQQPQQSDQHQPLTTLLRATSNNLRNLKVLFNHLKEVADFVTQQYLQALQLI